MLSPSWIAVLDSHAEDAVTGIMMLLACYAMVRRP